MYLPDNDVFTRSPLERLTAPGKPFPSRCHGSRPSRAGGQGRGKRFIRDRARPSRQVRDLPAGGWWSQTGSNRRPHACKARALPTELWPLKSRAGCWEPSADPAPAQGVTRPQELAGRGVVGPGRLELPTSRLSGVCSNQLSYRPLKRSAASALPGGGRARRMRDRTAASTRAAAVFGKRNEDGGGPHLIGVSLEDQ